MKHSRKLLAALVILSIVASFFILVDIRSSGTDVEMVQLDSSGDITVLNGLRVQSVYEMDNMMNWHVRTTFDSQGIQAVDTDYQYNQIRPPYRPQPKEPGIKMSTERSIPFFWDELIGEEDRNNGFARMLNELSSRTPKGEKAEEAFLLSDYEEHYRFSGEINLPNYQLYWGSDPFFHSEPEYEASVDDREAVAAGMRAFFRIPILPDEEVMISVEKDDEQGHTFSYGIGSTDSDSFEFRAFGVVIDDAFYFTFDTHSEEGKVVDTSLIPGGYGIYKLPFEEDEELGYRLRIDQLENVKKLDPDDSVHHLNMTSNDKSLAVHLISDETYTIDVLTFETLASTETIEIAPWSADMTFRDVYEGPDFLAIRSYPGITMLVSGNESGHYRFEFDYDVSQEQEPWLQPLGADKTRVGMTFDEGKLAAATTMTPDSVDYILTVIDHTGLLFRGEYSSQLDKREANPYTDDWYPVVNTTHENSLFLEWR